MTDVTQIEFTDRYGGRPPSWLRSCHGDCEAMGYVPIPFYEGAARENDMRVVVVDLTAQDIEDWRTAHTAAGEHECDDWHFVKCRACNGTGRVSWLVTVARIPRWIVKGVRFLPFAMSKEIAPEGWTWRKRAWVAVKAAWLCDLGVRM